MAGTQSSFEKAATGENTCPPALADNIIYRGDILTAMLAVRGSEGAIIVVNGVDKLKGGFECQGILAMHSFTDAIARPEAVRDDFVNQTQRSCEIAGINLENTHTIINLVDANYIDFITKLPDNIRPKNEVTDQQKGEFFTTLGKVPDVLKRAIDQDDIKIIVDNDKSLKGMVPKVFEGSSGLFHGGNIYITEPYQPNTIIEEMAHHADEKMQFVERGNFPAAISPLLADQNMLHTLGFALNKRYYQDNRRHDYMDKDANNVASEVLADMYVIRSDQAMGDLLDGRTAKMLTIETDHPEKISRIDGLEQFYDKVVKGKTSEQIEEFYEGREIGISLPIVDIMSPEDYRGRDLARAMSKVPEQKMDAIFKNKDNPEELLKTIYSDKAIEQLDKFSDEMEKQYPKPQEPEPSDDPQLKIIM